MASESDAQLQEDRSFPPTGEFKKHANMNDPAVWAKALQGREAYWASWAQQLDWETKWDTILERNPPYAKWVVGGKLNASYNCLDRHLSARGEKLADAAANDCPSLDHVVVVMRRSATEEADDTVVMKPGRDVWYHEALANASADCPPVFVDSEHMLYTLYTSGTTGKPKGIIHTTRGYLTRCHPPTH